MSLTKNQSQTETRLVTGNEAIALGALRAGVKVVTGYPGTPSTRALGSLIEMNLDAGRHIEWSTNEKVAFEIAAGAAWAGQRAMCTMKMSGLNVASDAVFSIAHSGVNGGLVIYVADDPGAHAGMVEQDSRGYARMMDLPMLEPTTVAEAYEIVPLAFDLSEQIGSPVFVRSVTAIANSHAPVAVEEPVSPADREAILERDITKYTKAGSAIAQAQHRDVIARLAQAGQIIRRMGLNDLQMALAGMETRPTLVETRPTLGVVASGVVVSYLEEGFEIASEFGFERDAVSVLRVRATNPPPTQEMRELLQHCDAILVLEDLEPYIERDVTIEACRIGFEGRIVGKLDGTVSANGKRGNTFGRFGAYGVAHVVRGIAEALGLTIPEERPHGEGAEDLAASRPITVCAGCPHRGTFMAINQALRNLKFKRDEVMVTGDIGCTILGMNPPFETVWNEVAMGASISLAQGYLYSGLETPVIATMGDSTFFHGGLPGLINAVQHQADVTLIVMDNGWTAMTGMQTNPGTDERFQSPGNRRIDLAELIPAMGVEHFFTIDPFDLGQATAAIQRALALSGVKVVLAQQECAIQAQRRGLKAGTVRVDPQACNLCKRCVVVTGCPAISLGEEAIVIDESLCYGCSLCAQVCTFDAIEQVGESAAGRM
ncbi:MAG: thiamine pyrophosphate-dependent enzyme [Anaerolineae bacterium]|jgi:indolepyruvate ferredoxin oxidoreductase alpha subunit